MNFAVDTGGTFTDLIIDTGSDLRMFKAPTTPQDPAQGVLEVFELAAAAMAVARGDLLAAGRLLVHGTTHAINALVTGTTARTAFLTTRGHPDILLFREGGRRDPFDFSVPYPEPLVPRSLTFEVPERVAYDGSVVEPLDELAVARILRRVEALGVAAIGVSLLWSIVNPAHELQVGELIERQLPGIPYTLSHRLNPTLREYRRSSSTCIDASLKPLMTDYFAALVRRLHDAGFAGRLLVVTSQGGALDAADVASAPVHCINSGPAMAPVAGRHYARIDTEYTTAIVADSGGTTFDVSLVRDARIPRTSETWIGTEYQGHITGFPSVDVTSIGAGGGSIAYVDEAGLLCVGPQSAGSVPGPACYGRGGTEPTLTDVCLLLGYLDPRYFLGGQMDLHPAAAEAALRHAVCDPLGLGVDEAALAVVRIATENMVHAIEAITINQGIDPRRALLVGGGGAAGLNLVAIGRRLGCPKVLIPETGAALSAGGALLSDLVGDFALTSVTRTDGFDQATVDRVLEELARRCRSFAQRSGLDVGPIVEYAFDGRYLRQNWDLEVPLELAGTIDGAGVAASFHRMHERVFAISEPDAPVQVTTWRARARLKVTDVSGRRLATGSVGSAMHSHRRVLFQGRGWIEAPVLHLPDLRDGERFAGPAVIESPFTTIVVDPDCVGHKTGSGSIVLLPTGEGAR